MSRQNMYHLAWPPRHVPWLVRSQLWFGGFVNQFGWLWLGFSLIFVWIFGLSADFGAVLFRLDAAETTNGVVSAVEETNASENDIPVYAYEYSFRVERLEAEYQGLSYSTGGHFVVGQPVVVEYLRRDPTISRIEGTRRALFGPWVLCIVLIFPLIGLGFVMFGLKNGWKANRLLVKGQVGLGVLKSKEATNTKVNGQRVYKLTFEFEADDGQLYEVITRTHRPYTLEDDAQERLLYDPAHPAYAVMLDSLPGAPDVDEMGHIRPASLKPGLLSLVLPTLVLGVNAMILLFLMV